MMSNGVKYSNKCCVTRQEAIVSELLQIHFWSN